METRISISLALAQSIAHDLRSPVNGIAGLLEILEEDYDTLPDEKKRKFIYSASLSAKRLRFLVEDLLALVTAQNDERANLTSTLLKPEVEKVKMLLSEHYIKKEIDIAVEMKNDLSILASPVLLRSVLQNLIHNAIKFSYPGQKVIISAEKKKDIVSVSVTDSGIGMNEEQKNKLFKDDSMKSSPGTWGERGTGLGMMICHQRLVSMGGNISVESEPDQGSCFTFTLPASN